MYRFFNTAGPNIIRDHYTVPPLERFELAEVLMLIAQKKYFILHAPRQTGKTSCMLALADYLNNEGTYKALYVNIEAAQVARHNIEQGIGCILSRLGDSEKLSFGTTIISEYRIT